ncbi:MAG: hypothetical protein AAF211_09070 [Myxococcota bacterium]
MDSLVDTVVSLPLEAQALALFSLVVVMVATARLVSGVRRPRPVPQPEHPRPDPVLAPESPRPVHTPPQGLDFDDNETLVPGRSDAPAPLEQIDLLSPSRDTPLAAPPRAEASTLADAKARVSDAVARTGETRGDDNLTAIRGLSPSHAHVLRRHGIRSFAQLGQLTDDELEAVALLLPCSMAQIRTDDWVGQARGLNARREDDRETA